MVYRRKKDLVTREIAGETLIVPIRGDFAHMQKILALDGVAAFIWNDLDGVKDEAQICRDVSDNFDTGDQDVASDTNSFLQQLIAADLIESV